jgi:hypothetical protein
MDCKLNEIYRGKRELTDKLKSEQNELTRTAEFTKSKRRKNNK